MKLNKVISLALGGVMALSMLAGCSSSGETETPVVSTETNATIVEYVENNVGSDKYNISVNQQAQVPFTGNEETDKAKVLKSVTSSDLASAISVANLKTVVLDATEKYSTPCTIYVEHTDDDTDTDLAKAILNVLENMKDGDVCIDTISVFDVVATTDAASITVDGTNLADLTEEYWAIRFVTCAKQVDGIVVNK